MEDKIVKIKELLKKENVRILDAVKDWKEAIRVSVLPLVEQGYCEERYIDGIIENTYKFGPYYVLCENMALLHAEADKGVNQTQLAITVLKKPIKFKEGGWDVRILIALGAIDAETHLYAMQAISNIFSNEEKISSILNTTSTEEIYNTFITSVDG